MSNSQDEVQNALKNERIRLEERLRLHQAEVSQTPGTSSTETPEEIMDKIRQVDRLIAAQDDV